MKSKNVSLAVEIYPREGTETVCLRPLRILTMLKFIPREGTETHSNLDHLHYPQVEIYPREGTETIIFADIKKHRHG